MQSAILIILISYSSLFFSGCASVAQKGKPADTQKISQLKEKVDELAQAKSELEEKLSKEISDKEVKIEMMKRGLVITFIAEVLFNSGQAELRKDSLEKLSKVAEILRTTVLDLDVGIEGHTDNQPIRRSGWKSNWELSAARAMNVLHYLIDAQQIDPRRLSATGFGEFHPAASNDSKEGQQKNRRVEIVILPRTIKQATDLKLGDKAVEDVKK